MISKMFALVCVLIGAASVATAQTEATRTPAEGLAIVDCAPNLPSVPDACIVRVPPRHQLTDGLTFNNADRDDAAFEFRGADHPEFPSSLAVSATAIMIDYTQGPGSIRRAQWGAERDYILQMIDGLPDGELVALYVFDDTVRELVGFTSQVSRVRRAVEDLGPPDGLNTIIGESVREVVATLSGRDNILLKNVIVISDGEEEADALTPDTVAEYAVENGVAISTMATLWRNAGGVGDNASARANAIAYMRRLAGTGLGSSAIIDINTPTEAAENTTEFARGIASSAGQSGLIVPVGEPSAAEIILTLGVPVAGRPGAFTSQSYTVAFTPQVNAADPNTAPDEADKDETGPFGYPWGLPEYAIYGGAMGFLLLFALLIFLLTRRKAPEADHVFENDDLDYDAPTDGTEGQYEMTGGVTYPEPAPAWAYLVRQDSGDRFTLTKRTTKIGRAPDNDVHLDGASDARVSRYHAELTVRPSNQIVLNDLNSANGVAVNGKRITAPTPINGGDILTFGDRDLKLILR